jgi:hypothetical protein
VIGALNNLGWSYTGTRWYRQRGFSDFGRGFADRVGKLGSAVKDQFMHSLSEARTTHYAQPPLTANIELVFRLLSEAYAAKHGEDFSVEQEGYKVSRLKTRSETECRVGRLYITRQRVFDNGRTTYTCTCPGYSYRPQRDCKHIKEMKSAQYPV